MQIQFECSECIMEQAVRLARNCGKNDAERWDFFDRAVEIFQQCRRAGATPPEVAARHYALFSRLSGETDPFREVKSGATRIANALYPRLEKLCIAAGDPFTTRLKFAISGNMIDYGVNPSFDLNTIEDTIHNVIGMPYDAAAVEDLRRRISVAGKIVYILDNCGEAVLDRLLLEVMAEKVTIVVRGKPILNDITPAEVAVSGLGGFPVADTGSNFPGVPADEMPEHLHKLFSEADLVIAKGQGNFESMEGSFSTCPIYYLFRAKCPVICSYIGAEHASLQVIGRNLS